MPKYVVLARMAAARTNAGRQPIMRVTPGRLEEVAGLNLARQLQRAFRQERAPVDLVGVRLDYGQVAPKRVPRVFARPVAGVASPESGAPS